MPLDDLVQVIETLQQRIRDYGDSLRQNEIRTRVALIDPLLTALGWDVSDPRVVTAEYAVGGGRADYALHTSGAIPAATFEAKKLGESLEPHRMQMLNYSNAAGIRFAGLTDGNRWELYEIFKQGTLDERRILEAVISSESSARLALRFLLLWHPNLGSGKPVEAYEPVLDTRDPESEQINDQARKLINPDIPTSMSDGWYSLASLQTYRDVRFPTAIRLPNEEEQVMSDWRDVLKEVAEWQIRLGNLVVDKCPIWSTPKANTRYIVHTRAEHSNGKAFENPYMLKGGFFLEVHGREWALKGSMMILDTLGVSTESVQIKQS